MLVSLSCSTAQGGEWVARGLPLSGCEVVVRLELMAVADALPPNLLLIETVMVMWVEEEDSDEDVRIVG